MNTAVTPVNGSAPLQFHWDADNEIDQYYSFLHFNEVEKLAENETRAFNIIVNEKFRFGPVIPTYQKTNTIFSVTPFNGATRYQVSLSKTDNSTLPPILNAYDL